MKQFHCTIGFLVLAIISSFGQKPLVIDLQKQIKSKGLQVYNREMSPINEAGYSGIRMSKDYGEGLVWLKGIDFSNGILEFDVRGENIKQHSFVGIAFHGQNDSTYDAIYLRPFQFQEKDEALRSHQLQYISLPEFTWRVLRAKFPDKYEHSIDPSPDPTAWVNVRLVVNGSTVSTYINGSKEPSLVVDKVTATKNGKIGFYVADTSGGDFANLKITKAN